MFFQINCLNFFLLTLSFFPFFSNLPISAMEEQKPTHKEITEVKKLPLGRENAVPYYLVLHEDKHVCTICLEDNNNPYMLPIVAYTMSLSHRLVVDFLADTISLERMVGQTGAATRLDSCLLPSRSNGVAISPDGTFAVATHFGTNVITTYALHQDRLKKLETYNLPDGADSPWGAAIAPDGSSVAITLERSNRVILIPLRDQRLIMGESAIYNLPPGAESPSAVAYAASGSGLAVANYGSNSAVYASLRPGTTVLERFSHRVLPPGSSGPVAIIFSRQDDSFMTANYLSRDLSEFMLGDAATLVDTLPACLMLVLVAYALRLSKTQKGIL